MFSMCLRLVIIEQFSALNLDKMLTVGGGGGGGSESMDGRGFAILALELVPKNLIFAQKSCPKIYFIRFYACCFGKETMPH